MAAIGSACSQRRRPRLPNSRAMAMAEKAQPSNGIATSQVA